VSFFKGIGDAISGVGNVLTSGIESVGKTANSVVGSLSPVAESLAPAYMGYRQMEFDNAAREDQLEIAKANATAAMLRASGATLQRDQQPAQSTNGWVMPVVVGVGAIGALSLVMMLLKGKK
jgi:hypothetical protein